MQPTVHFEPPIQQHTRGPVIVYADSRLVPPEGVRDLLRLPEILEHLAGSFSRQAGRRTVWRWNPPWLTNRRLVVRQFAHGGLLGRLRGTVFLSCRSMLRELRIALHARSRGVPTCRPVALRLQRMHDLFWQAHYLSEEIPRAEDLLQLCRRAGPESPYPPARRQELARSVAKAIAAMHDAGIRHDDLNLKNLLVAEREGRLEVHVIDFKKALLQNCVDRRARLRNLVRLDRSVVKWLASRRAVTASDRLRALRAYLALQTDAGEDWKEVARRIRTGHWIHALSRKYA